MGVSILLLLINSSQQWHFDSLKLDYSNREVSCELTMATFRPRQASQIIKFTTEDSWRYTYHPTVADVKRMAIIEGNLLDYTRTYFDRPRLIIHDLLISGFRDTEYGRTLPRSSCTIKGLADHAVLNREDKSLLDFTVGFEMTENFTHLILEFIKLNVGEVSWEK